MLCGLYNELRDLKIDLWKAKRVSLDEGEMRQIALDKRKQDKGLQTIHSQVVQHVAIRVYTAFKNYFEGRARFPKRKRLQKYRSLTYPQSGFKLVGEVVEKGRRVELKGRLYLSKAGYVRIFMHRPLEGAVKNLTVKYDAGEWHAIFI
jgi:putative transposase